MKVFVVLALVAVASAGIIPATTLVRTPSLDSAVIQSDRLGGNFAYSSVEGHAYAAISPVVQNVVSPIGISYSATPIATPVNVLHHQVIAPHYIAPHLIGSPLISSGAIYGAPSIISPVAPGIIAPSIPISPSDNLVPIVPEEIKESEIPKEEIPAVVEAVAPIAEEPVPVPEAPQSDDVVAVESV